MIKQVNLHRSVWYSNGVYLFGLLCNILVLIWKSVQDSIYSVPHMTHGPLQIIFERTYKICDMSGEKSHRLVTSVGALLITNYDKLFYNCVQVIFGSHVQTKVPLSL